MRLRFRTLVETEAADCARLFTRLGNYPKRGRHVGAGPHVAMPDTWDGRGDTPPGWTRGYAHRAEFTGDDEPTPTGAYVVALNRADVDLLDDADARRRLSTTELTEADLFRTRLEET